MNYVPIPEQNLNLGGIPVAEEGVDPALGNNAALDNFVGFYVAGDPDPVPVPGPSTWEVNAAVNAPRAGYLYAKGAGVVLGSMRLEPPATLNGLYSAFVEVGRGTVVTLEAQRLPAAPTLVEYQNASAGGLVQVAPALVMAGALPQNYPLDMWEAVDPTELPVAEGDVVRVTVQYTPVGVG